MARVSVYRHEGKWWIGGFGDIENIRAGVDELAWMFRHGKWSCDWNWPQLIIGIGRTWYDGPVWFAHLGIFGVSIHCE